MAEYIESERLRESLKNHYYPTDQEYESDRQWAVGYNAGLDRALHSLHYAPAAEVVPVVHGEWVQVIHHVEFEDGFVDRLYECCSRCHEPNGGNTSNYCPNCGARMDGE